MGKSLFAQVISTKISGLGTTYVEETLIPKSNILKIYSNLFGQDFSR